MTENKQKQIKTLLGFAVGVVVMFLMQQYLFKAPSFDKQMVQLASELNKTCPMMIDAETRWDNTVALPGNTFQYNYTLINLLKDSTDLERIEEYLNPIILNTIKTNPDLKLFRDNNVIMSYNYKDKNSIHLFKLTFSPEQYK